eukprot:1938395-Amphidinium_carterae.1
MKSRTRPAGEVMNLELGALGDFYRDPPDKSASGWRGPAVIASLDRLGEGVIEIRYQGRLLPCQVRDVRRTLVPAMLVYFRATGAANHLHQEAQHLDRQYVQLGLKQDGHGNWTQCAMNATQLKLLRAALYFAHHYLHLEHVIQVCESWSEQVAIECGAVRFDHLQESGNAWIFNLFWVMNTRDSVVPPLSSSCLHEGNEMSRRTRNSLLQEPLLGAPFSDHWQNLGEIEWESTQQPDKGEDYEDAESADFKSAGSAVTLQDDIFASELNWNRLLTWPDTRAWTNSHHKDDYWHACPCEINSNDLERHEKQYWLMHAEQLSVMDNTEVTVQDDELNATSVVTPAWQSSTIPEHLAHRTADMQTLTGFTWT